MILFNYFINFLEGLILSTFIAYYFNVGLKKIYIFIVSIICFLEISISNYFNTFDEMLIFLVIITSFISLWKEKNSSYFEKIFICSLSAIFLLFGNLFSILVTTIVFDITTVQLYTKDIYYIFVALFSKTIYALFSFMCCYLKRKYKYYLTLQNGWIILLLSLTIIYVISTVMETLLIGTFTSQDAISLTIALIVICILFLLIFRQLQIENENKLKYELQLQKNHYSKENYAKMTFMSNEIVETEHRMMYVLMHINYQIIDKQYEKATIMLEQYIKKVKKFSSVINTNNPYFDFVLSAKINEFMHEDIYLKNTLFILENDIYNSIEFCELILNLLDIFRSNLLLKNGLSLEINQENDFIIIKLIGNLTGLELSSVIYNKIDYFHADYSIDNFENIYTFKLIIQL